jgi:hypothetical protein
MTVVRFRVDTSEKRVSAVYLKSLNTGIVQPVNHRFFAERSSDFAGNCLGDHRLVKDVKIVEIV